LQLHPLGSSQNFPHFHCHHGIGPFQFTACLGDSIDLGENGVPIKWIGFEQLRQLRFLFIEGFGARREILPVTLEGFLELRLLIVCQSESRDGSGIRPPCSLRPGVSGRYPNRSVDGRSAPTGSLSWLVGPDHARIESLQVQALRCLLQVLLGLRLRRLCLPNDAGKK
jgi:hypothetical protein